MNKRDNDLIFGEALDLLVGKNMVVDASKALEILLKLKADGYKISEGFELKDGIDMTLDDFITISRELSEFSATPNNELSFDCDLDSVFKAAKAGSGLACLEMFCNTILKENREYTDFEELITNFNIGGYYLIKGMEYGSIDAKIRLGIAYAMGDFGIINKNFALKIADELEEEISLMVDNKDSNYEISDCYEDPLEAVDMIRDFARADVSLRFKD